MGEGTSMGPLNPKMKAEMGSDQGDIKFKVTWNTLGEYLNFLEKKGVSCNVASFIGAGTVRVQMLLARITARQRLPNLKANAVIGKTGHAGRRNGCWLVAYLSA